MKFEDIDFENTLVITSPRIAGKGLPADIEELRQDGLKIDNLLEFFGRADFFNHASCPKFLLSDNLFPYLLLEKYAHDVYIALGEAFYSIDEFKASPTLKLPEQIIVVKFPHEHVRTTLKRTRLLRSIFISLHSALDSMTGCVAILLDKGSKVRPDFQNLKKDIDEYTAHKSANLKTPAEETFYLDLLKALKPIVVCSDPEEGWYDFFLSQRHSYSHSCGRMHFSIQCKDSKLYPFFIRKQPYFFEDDVALAGVHDKTQYPDRIKELIMWQDEPSYLDQLNARVIKIVSKTFEILNKFYSMARKLGVGPSVITSRPSQIVYSFKRFHKIGV